MTRARIRARSLRRRGATTPGTHSSGRGVPGLIVDLFCGGGGASLGITWATGRKVDVAVNHSAAAIAMHEINHPDTIHFQTDVFDVPPRKTVKRRKVDILWLSPDCFPAGTMVKTRRGYQPIEDVQIGDEVLTHRARWRRVTSVMSKDFDGELVVIHAHSLSAPLRVTPEHPFLVGGLTWTPARDLTTSMTLTAITGLIGSVAPTYVPSRIDSITHERATLQVFNISVDEDESYIVDGIIVHNCTHHSRARGGKPRDNKLRSLAWVGVNWAREVQPRLIFLENVPEFVTWGPLYAAGDLLDDGTPVPDDLIDTPIPSRRGEIFQSFIGALGLAGYKVEWRKLKACDYGAPTTRERLYLIARCDDAPIVWPEPTHGPGRPLPWRTAAECIDWTIPCRSIFGRKKDLAEATQRRIAEGMRRYVLGSRRPFLVNLTHGGRLEGLDEPMKTVTAAHRGEKALITPYLMANNTNNVPSAIDAPVPTVTTGNRNYLLTPFIARYHGERRPGETPRVESVEDPLPTQTTEPRFAVVAPVLSPFIVNTRNGEREGQAPRTRPVDVPLPTTTAAGSQGAVVAAFLAKHYTGAVGSSLEAPLGTVTAIDHHSLVAAHVSKLYGTSTGSGLDEPLHTITGQGGKHALVAAFLLKFYGQGGQWSGVDEPMHTIVTKARMGLVITEIDGEEYVVVDIGFRMLEPRELARAQGLPDDYEITGTKEQQIARIGNSVCPDVPRALVLANMGAT